MSAVFLTEEQLLCSICLEVFTEPVTTPCGHNFCRSCISTHWQQGAPCLCPLCKQEFSSQPQLQVNTLVSELVGQFKNRPEEGAVSSDTAAAEGDVPCDVCTEPKQKALRSCLVCLLSYCQSHLLPHQSLPRLSSHPLTEPEGRLEDRLCPTHHRALELFCRSDQACVCLLCSVLEHKNHQVVSLREEYELQQGALQSTRAETERLMKERQEKIQEVRRWLQQTDRRLLTQTERAQQLHSALMETVQSSLRRLTEELQEEQRSAHTQAQDWITQLQQELKELQRRSTQEETLQRNKDHLTFLQSLPLKTTAGLKDWAQTSLQEPAFETTVDQAMTQLHSTLTEEMKKQTAKTELSKLKKWAVDVTFDPDTAYPSLVLSEDLKQVYHGDVRKDLPQNSKRFTDYIYVLGKQSFSSRKCYFEVQVKGKTNWDVGVAKESVNRKVLTLTPEKGIWVIVLRDKTTYQACDAPCVTLSLQSVPAVISVFVDYEKGLVSFYDTDSGALIYSFTKCCFTEKLCPYFSPGYKDKGVNSAALVIMPCEEEEQTSSSDVNKL